MIFSPIDICILTTLLICWFIQLFYYWVYLNKPYCYQQKVNKGKIAVYPACPPVSVIIYARNEARNLEKYLPAILNQNYPQYEVIVVDDGSDDDTEIVIKQLAVQNKHLYYTFIPPESKYINRRKLSLTVGIKAAHCNNLLFLDADTYPISPDWLGLMAQHFVRKTTVVLGFSILEKHPFRYAEYDYFFSNLQMMALALANRAYAGNGRNLGYCKSELSWQRIFSNFDLLETGDDNSSPNELPCENTVSLELSPDSVTRVNMDKWWMWRELKMRRIETSSFHRKFSIIFWGVEKLSRMLFYFLFLFACVWLFPNWIVIGIVVVLFLTRFLTQWIVINRTTGILKLPKFHFSLLISDFFQPFANGYFYLYKTFHSKSKEYRRHGQR